MTRDAEASVREQRVAAYLSSPTCFKISANLSGLKSVKEECSSLRVRTPTERAASVCNPGGTAQSETAGQEGHLTAQLHTDILARMCAQGTGPVSQAVSLPKKTTRYNYKPSMHMRGHEATTIKFNVFLAKIFKMLKVQ